jgi:hypothetical protein
MSAIKNKNEIRFLKLSVKDEKKQEVTKKAKKTSA